MMRISVVMIAPCGINCGFCMAHLRDKNKCPGCNSDGPGKLAIKNRGSLPSVSNVKNFPASR